MDYQTLIREWKRYPREWDYSYNRSISSAIWKNPLLHVEKKVQFLNDWLCRIDRKTAIPQLKEHSIRLSTIIKGLSSLSLLDLSARHFYQIKQAYGVLVEVNGLGPTGISKYLHMHLSELFIMWDNQIFRDYFHIRTVLKSTATSIRYLKFMLRMKNEIQEALSSYTPPIKINQNDAIRNFRKCFNDETIPRILDKYNYVTREIPKRVIR